MSHFVFINQIYIYYKKWVELTADNADRWNKTTTMLWNICTLFISILFINKTKYSSVFLQTELGFKQDFAKLEKYIFKEYK